MSAPGSVASAGSQLVGAAAVGLQPASLAQVVDAAGLLTRVDRKHLVPLETFRDLVDRLGGGFSVLEIDGLRAFRYESVYFDTDDHLLFRHHVQGRRCRYKVRTRSYLDSGETVFEVKLKGSRGETVKHRLPHASDARRVITPEAQDFLDRLLQEAYGRPAPTLRPRVTTLYRRTTLVDLAGGARLTCDVDLTCSEGSRSVDADTHVVVESKSVDGRGAADAALRELGVRPVAISKYCVGVALLNPHLVASPWSRTLRRYYDYERSAA